MTTNPTPMNPNTEREEICSICKQSLVNEEWIDDEEYGDVHTRCLNEIQR